LCLGTSTTPSSQFPIYAYSIYAPGKCNYYIITERVLPANNNNPGSHCNGIFASDANIGSSPPICDISKDEFSFDFCKKSDAKFVNEGPEFFSECGFQLSLNGKKYTPLQLDPMDTDNPCSGTCPDVVSVQGILLFEGMPACN
jgi:hypothetical protein